MTMKLSSLRIIGEKREKDFNKLGVFDGDDLIRFYPRAYLDLTERPFGRRTITTWRSWHAKWCRSRPSIT